MKQFTYIALIYLFISLPLSADFAQLEQKAQKMGCDLSKGWVEVSVPEQKLRLWQGKHLVCSYSVSTALRGVGQQEGSEKTPLGLHRIKRKVGDRAPLYTIFKSLSNTGRCWDPSTHSGDQDLILTRVITLEGLEEGYNRGFTAKKHNVDSLKRQIYIHGTPEENMIGKPVSHGCVRLRNADILVLFEQLEIGMAVWIHNDPSFKP